MRRFNFLLTIPLLFLALNCSNAKSNENNGAGEVVILNKADFLTKIYNYEKNESEWVYEGKQPCIIDFYADWCGPCKRVAPIMAELASEYKDKVIIYKIDVDQEKELAAVFGVSSIPMILFVPVAGKPQVAMGALPKETMIAQIDSFLLGKE